MLVEAVKFDIGAGDGDGDILTGGNALDLGGLALGEGALASGFRLAPQTKIIIGADGGAGQRMIALRQEGTEFRRKAHVQALLCLDDRTVDRQAGLERFGDLVAAGDGLQQAGVGGLDVGRIGEGLVDQAVKLRIVEAGPPVLRRPGAVFGWQALRGGEIGARRDGLGIGHGSAIGQQGTCQGECAQAGRFHEESARGGWRVKAFGGGHREEVLKHKKVNRTVQFDLFALHSDLSQALTVQYGTIFYGNANKNLEGRPNF